MSSKMTERREIDFGLLDLVLSWTVEDIFNEDRCRDKRSQQLCVADISEDVSDSQSGYGSQYRHQRNEQ
ncbi:hypothetical protein AAC387_Pa07g1282 [Persea americana]